MKYLWVTKGNRYDTEGSKEIAPQETDADPDRQDVWHRKRGSGVDRKYALTGHGPCCLHCGTDNGQCGIKHKTVRHSVGEYVRGREEVHTNGMEIFRAMLKRARKGVYHKMIKKHMGRYVKEFVGRYNAKKADMIYQVRSMVCGVEGKGLR